MNLQYKYWYFEKALTPRICDEIIKLGLSEKYREQTALTGNKALIRDLKKHPITKKEMKDLKKVRHSNVTWLDDKWIYDEIQPYVHIANRNAGWNFDWDWSESCQFTKYAKGQFYDWHCDSWETGEKMPNGKIRKLSVTVTLSDPKDYKGGELEFDYRNQDPTKKRNIVKCTEILKRGSIVVFPSHLWHRVCPVTKGTRYSLVMWNQGYPFK